MNEEVINLPYGYKQCLFLESTGTQYINTNYVATNNTGAYVKWSLTNIKNYSNVLSSLGISTDDTADSGFMIPHWNGDNNAYLSVFMSRSENVLRLENQTTPTLYSIHESRLNYYNSGEVYIDTTLMGSVDNVSENIENDLPLYLFGCNKLNALSTENSMIGRIYRVTITEGEEVVMDLIPCLDDKGKPCMYDLVTQTPFYNANAEGNDFRYVVKGKIPSWYKRVEYLENTSKSYINTNYIPNNETGLYIEAHTTKSNDSVPMGSRESDGKRIYAARNTYNTLYGWNTYYDFGLGTAFTFQRYKATTNFLNNRTATFIINDEIKSTKNLAVLNYTPTQPFYIFGNNSNGVLSTAPHIGKIYRAKISQGTEIVKDFVPTLDDNDMPCMFDLVEGIPYYNVGSGEFLYNKGIEGNYTKFGQLSVMGNRLGGGTDGLPPAYTRVNYLESTGTQYIDTSIVTDGTYTICAKMNLSHGSGWGRAFKTSDYDIGGCSYCRRITNASGYYCLNFLYYWSGGTYPNHPDYTDVEWDFNEANVFEAKEGTTSVLINGKKSNLRSLNTLKIDASNPNNLSHYVFWANGVFSNGNGKSIMKLYNFSIKDGSEKIVLDFIPCLDDNGRPCMFDRVSRKPFYNSGTGEFLYG